MDANRINVVTFDNYHANVPLMGTNSLATSNFAGVCKNEISLVVNGHETSEKSALVEIGCGLLQRDPERLGNKGVKLSLDRRHYCGKEKRRAKVRDGIGLGVLVSAGVGEICELRVRVCSGAGLGCLYSCRSNLCVCRGSSVEYLGCHLSRREQSFKEFSIFPQFSVLRIP